MGGNAPGRAAADSPIAQLCLQLDGNLRRLQEIRRYGRLLRTALDELAVDGHSQYRSRITTELAMANSDRWTKLWRDRSAARLVRLRAGEAIPAILAQSTTPKAQATARGIPAAVRKAVLSWSGASRCAYCGLPLVMPAEWNALRTANPCILPNARLVNGVTRAMGGGPLGLQQRAPIVGYRHQFEHLVPHSAGGAHTPSNIVSSCGWCNIAKGRRTLKAIGVSRPTTK